MNFKKLIEDVYELYVHPFPATIIKETDEYFEFERLNSIYRITRDINFENFILKKHGISCISAFGYNNDGYYSFDLYFGLDGRYYSLEADFNTTGDAFRIYVRRQSKENVFSFGDMVFESNHASLLNQIMVDLKERIYNDKFLRLKFITGLINLTDVTIPIK